MKPTLLLTAFIACYTTLHAQLPVVFYDTLVVERFVNDPTANMEPIPTGNDQVWINFDQDGYTGKCINGQPTPGGWYWEKDFSTDDPTDNSCFTSCSYVDDNPTGDFPSANWLILPPVAIPDSFCVLEWHSLSFQGPAFLDGYQVLVAEGTNDVFSNVFQDTLFTAASMIQCAPGVNCGSYNPSEYVFTPGYIHANGFTNTDYFFDSPQISNYRGKLEPHAVSLSKYAGKTIYIAFLHDSNNDNLLQVDDILVVDQKTSSTGNTGNIAYRFTTAPNPASAQLHVEWTLHQTADTQLEVRDLAGNLIHAATFAGQPTHQYDLNIDTLARGVYMISIRTAAGMATQRFVKM